MAGPPTSDSQEPLAENPGSQDEVVIRHDLVGEVGLALVAFQRASDVVAQAVGELTGLNRNEMRCLGMLFTEGSLSAGQLAAGTGLTSGAITALVDRFENAGLARRVRDQRDRRRVLVELTDAALRQSAAIFGDVAAAGCALAESYEPARLATVLDFLRRETELQEQFAEKLRSKTVREKKSRGA